MADRLDAEWSSSPAPPTPPPWRPRRRRPRALTRFWNAAEPASGLRPRRSDRSAVEAAMRHYLLCRAWKRRVQPPQSATWQVHIDRSMWIGGVRGLMLQALHPLAMRGVWQNSNFQEDPFGRLQRTADFVGRRHLRQPGGGRRARPPGPRDPPGAAHQRPRHRQDPPRRRPRAAAVGALRRGLLLPGGRPPGGPRPQRPPGRPLPGRAAPQRHLRGPARRGRARHASRRWRTTSPAMRPRLRVTPEARLHRALPAVAAPARTSCGSCARASRRTSRSARCATTRCPAGPGGCTASCPRCRSPR